MYEPSFERTDRIDMLCMEIAELLSMISPDAPLAKSPTLHRELRIKAVHSSLMIEGGFRWLRSTERQRSSPSTMPA